MLLLRTGDCCRTSAGMSDSPQIIVLFSGGLDSLLTAKLLERQGLAVRCLHFYSPFFGGEAVAARWRKTYDLDIVTQDVGPQFAAMLRQRPEHGFGKVLNPCVDCKILLLREARKYMESVGAKALASGEVLGQRPMSQRRDTLNVIMRDAIAALRQDRVGAAATSEKSREKKAAGRAKANVNSDDLLSELDGL